MGEHLIEQVNAVEQRWRLRQLTGDVLRRWLRPHRFQRWEIVWTMAWKIREHRQIEPVASR